MCVIFLDFMYSSKVISTSFKHTVGNMSSGIKQIVGLHDLRNKQNVGMLNHIKELRLNRNMTLEGLTKAVGTTNQQIHHLESGKRRLTLDWMQKLAKALKCDPADLIASVSGDKMNYTAITAPIIHYAYNLFRDITIRRKGLTREQEAHFLEILTTTVASELAHEGSMSLSLAAAESLLDNAVLRGDAPKTKDTPA